MFVPQLADRDDGGQRRALALHVVEFDWKENAEYGHIEAYVCRTCGFMELYVREPKSVPIDGKSVPGIEVLHDDDSD